MLIRNLACALIAAVLCIAAQDVNGTALTEGLLMASRDGIHFERWNEAFLRPGPERPDTWLYGHQFIAWRAVETSASLRGAPPAGKRCLTRQGDIPGAVEREVA